ncbi:MAG: carbohydrate kinase family protein [Steroidobacteraceae bacterium]|jgi:adenosine kinase|nr:carbohydrate kinase family protein [Steroidobacteraceae bacterium]
MTALISGSLAYDTIMVFNGRFRESILPDKIHMLSVSFLVPELRRNFGGCAGNIAFNARLLGLEARVIAAVGDDFDSYETWMRRHGLSTASVRRIEGLYTAQAYITTDLEDNQITAFHPGAMACSGELALPADTPLSIGIVAPDSREAMIVRAQQLADAGVPFVFDPGQALPLFGGQDLEMFIDQAAWVVVNDYEGQLVQERTGLSPERIAQRCRAYVVTHGGQGSTIHVDGRRITIPPVKAERVVDPTGCGDAYRAGLLYGLTKGLDWETTGRVASLMGSLKIAHAGTQTHAFTFEEFATRYRMAFGHALAR